jgi:catechol 2,3-dioxygenase-like lactoylglutathione lyase family enzyme
MAKKQSIGNGRPFMLSLLKIPVNDIEVSSEFYAQNLGFQVDFVAPEYGWAQMKTGEISVALYKPGMGGGEREIGGSVDFHLMLEEDDFDEVVEKVKEEGVLLDDMVHTGADGTTFIEILDPDQNVIKVFKCLTD